jgi:hypothetical protein
MRDRHDSAPEKVWQPGSVVEAKGAETAGGPEWRSGHRNCGAADVPPGDRADLGNHFRMLRGAKDELLDFVSERNAAAALALESRPDAQQSFHRLALHVTFLSTDLMQRCCATGGEAMGNLKRWSGKEDMIPRLVASGLMWVEAGFRRIRHAEDPAGGRAASTPTCSLSFSQKHDESHPNQPPSVLTITRTSPEVMRERFAGSD